MFLSSSRHKVPYTNKPINNRRNPESSHQPPKRVQHSKRNSTMPPNAPLEPPPDRKLPQHGVKGAYYAGHWVDLEDCAGKFQPDPSTCSQCPTQSECPRSQSRNAAKSTFSQEEIIYDVVIIGSGCIGSAIARELSRYSLKTLLLESADDVSQGATKGNSGIVHAGYDDKPGSLHAKFCWPGNQMFPQLDRELRFGYQLNGSLVLATNKEELKILDELMERGRQNGVQRLRIVQKKELFEMEPALNPNGAFCPVILDTLLSYLPPDADTYTNTL